MKARERFYGHPLCSNVCSICALDIALLARRYRELCLQMGLRFEMHDNQVRAIQGAWQRGRELQNIVMGSVAAFVEEANRCHLFSGFQSLRPESGCLERRFHLRID